MSDKKNPDYFLLGIIVVLNLLGVMILAGASAPFALKNLGSPMAYLIHQGLYGILPGIAAGLVAFIMPAAFWRKIAILMLVANIILLVLVFMPMMGGQVRGGAARWISFGPISFQPSEFLKLTFVIYLASWAASHLDGRMRHAKNLHEKAWSEGLAPFLIIIAVVGFLLVLQPDISTLGIIVASGFAIYFAARTPLWHTISIMAIGGILLAILVKAAPYRLARILVFINPSLDPMGLGYQIKQALIAVGSGGLAGVGLGMGYQQIQFLPAAMSDAIFAVFAQETGFLGAVVLVFLFLTFLWRGMTIAKRTSDFFTGYVAVGISFWITMQAFINISSMLGLLPLSGIPLPFISYGGSHLIAELAGAGLLLNISRRV